MVEASLLLMFCASQDPIEREGVTELRPSLDDVDVAQPYKP